MSGRTVQYNAISPQEFATILTPMLGEKITLDIAEMYEWEGAWCSKALSPDVAEATRVLDVEPQPLEVWAKEAFNRI
ncbi:MAG TPA: hypothetical protein VM871_06400 [Flavisolibacter sp.]|nr:hypothetical protein [Flavisolibacter sp.]